MKKAQEGGDEMLNARRHKELVEGLFLLLWPIISTFS
jgi:hypothetical protein